MFPNSSFSTFFFLYEIITSLKNYHIFLIIKCNYWSKFEIKKKLPVVSNYKLCGCSA